MRALSWLKDLYSNERGNVLLVGAATLPLLVGAAAIAVDSINLTLARRQLQRTADSGALAGAYAIVQNQPVSAAVNRDLLLNPDLPLKTKTIENAPTAGSHINDTQAVRVILSSERKTPFMAFFNDKTPTILVEATAAVVFNGKFCMVSLEDGNSAAGVTFTGSSVVDLGCGVATNSRATSAISCGGSTTVIASPVAAVGGVPACSGYAGGTRLMPYSAKQTDPFATLPVPVVPDGSCPKLRVQPNDTLQTYSPGCYAGMDIKGPVNLAPGTYYINGDSFSAGSQAKISGTGVTIILTSRTASTDPSSVATVSINGGAQLNLTAPKDGTFGGVLMYQDPRATLGNTVQINGNSLTSYEGAFYFPRAHLTFNGTTGMNTQCLQLVARRLAFSGNSAVSNTCPSDSKSKAFDAIFVRLVA